MDVTTFAIVCRDSLPTVGGTPLSQNRTSRMSTYLERTTDHRATGGIRTLAEETGNDEDVVRKTPSPVITGTTPLRQTIVRTPSYLGTPRNPGNSVVEETDNEDIPRRTPPPPNAGATTPRRTPYNLRSLELQLQTSPKK